MIAPTVANVQAHLAKALKDYAGRIAVVSSFGTESAVLLAMVADLDRTVPVLFLKTDRHFPETTAYRVHLARTLGLTDVRDLAPTPEEAASEDPTGTLWYFDPDACCALRKVRPLAAALAPFDAWISGRKRHQATTRQSLSFTEWNNGKLKINPLADWTAAEIEEEFVRRVLPRHPLRAQGYPSIGCAPCTRPVAEGEDARAGRWAHAGKVECGIHRPIPRTE